MAATCAAGDRGRDYARLDRLRADVAQDRWRMNEDIRRGRDRAAAQDARDLARDQRSLDALERDVRHDQGRDYRDYRNDWRAR